MAFFAQHSAALTPRALAIIHQFTEEFSIYIKLDIFLEASTDTSEVLPYDRGLDMRRGQAVAEAIRQFGIAKDSRFHVRALGTSVPLVQTPPRTAEAQNRSVILFTRGGEQILPTPLQAECLAWLRTHSCGPQAGAEQKAICSDVKIVTGKFTP